MKVLPFGGRKSTVIDMTEGGIAGHVLRFALPLMLGNIFQLLYNTVDSVVVGKFVGTSALAAVGSTGPIVNILVFFFNGFSVGAGVVIGKLFGAKDRDSLHEAIETTMATAFLFCIFLSVIGYLGTVPVLKLISTPDDVMAEATLYLRIYFAGLSGLLIYNIGSGILRAVGDTTRPLMFLTLTSVLNILLDLLFVLVFHAGVDGVAYATVISQLVSAVLILRMLTKTEDIYRMDWRELTIDLNYLRQISAVGMPAALQSVITSFSNTFIQGYINVFGSACMAGWSCFGKLDQFLLLPVQSMAMASTTFVSQNMGADKPERADKGTATALALACSVILSISVLVMLLAKYAVGLFSDDASVIEYGVMFVRINTMFMVFNCITHVTAGALRGRGDSKGPMVLMLLTFAALRQIYLFFMTNYISNTPAVVAFSYPVGWMSCAVAETVYYRYKKKRAELYY